MMKLLFLDSACPGPYRFEDLASRGMGGTEATVLRVTEALARRGHRVHLCQTGRERIALSPAGVTYQPFDFRGGPAIDRPDAVVVVRADKLLRRTRRTYPRAALYLWLHCFPGTRRARMLDFCRETGATIVAVSDTQARAVAERCGVPVWALPVRRIYNPVRPDLRPSRRRRDRDLLVSLSSPHKGLDQVLDNFRRVREVVPSMRLELANPGYLRGSVEAIEGVRSLGVLPQPQALERLSQALCLFYPQSSFPETFGLVFAEANALGTPVLAHPLGAAPEVLRTHTGQLVDADDPEAVVAKILDWRAGRRPRLGPDPRFALEKIVAEWESLLTGARLITTRQAA